MLLVILFYVFIIGEEDYIGVDSSLIFPTGSVPGDNVSVSIAIIDDLVLENTENFVAIGMTTQPSLRVEGVQSVFSIIDNDGTQLVTYILYSLPHIWKHAKYGVHLHNLKWR